MTLVVVVFQTVFLKLTCECECECEQQLSEYSLFKYLETVHFESYIIIQHNSVLLSGQKWLFIKVVNLKLDDSISFFRFMDS